MRIPYSWLKDFINLRISAEEVASDLSLSVIGVDSVEAVGREKVLNLDVTYNRGDLLSVAGVARELAAMYNLKYKIAEEPFKSADGLDPLHIKADSRLSRTYSLTKISNLRYKGTPPLIKSRLELAGMRSVNLWADLTNYVMLEWGQPFHAFDAEKVVRRDPTLSIEVRLAKNGEKIKTLDGLERTLTSQDMVIADRKGAIAIAGVMGGEETEVDEGTKEILLEAAIFDPIRIRNTARKLGLRSEASHRFEHYLSSDNLIISLNKIVQMFEVYGKAKVSAFNLVGEKVTKTDPVVLRQEVLDRAAGIKIPVSSVKEALKLLNFKVLSSDQGLLCWPPHYRGDIHITEDVVEEVLRMYGYQNIPAQPLEISLVNAPENKLEDWRDRVTHSLAGLGFNEVRTYSFLSTKSLLHNEVKELTRVTNPISAETEYLRSRLVFNLAEEAQLNTPKFPQGKIFELEKVYPKEGEYLALGGLIWGFKQPFLILKGTLEAILQNAGIEAEFQPVNLPYLHPTQAAQITIGKQILGVIGVLHPHLSDSYDLKDAAVFEVNFELFSQLARRFKDFHPLSGYPEILEDFSFTLDEKYSLGKLISAIKNLSDLVSEVEITDRYLKGELRSVTLRVTFQSLDRGLADKDVKPLRESINQLIKKNHGISRS
ncbi:MAG: phenylalanine--tRNA ligase subunit beta [Patescibacteria group bacterium]